MKQILRTVIAMALASSTLGASETTETFTTVEAAPGIWVFVAPEAKSALVQSNCVAIIGDDGVVVVDPGQIPSLAKKMIKAIRARTDKPVRYVVNTHWHWDHNLANSVFAEAYPGVGIIATEFTRKSLVDYTPPFLSFLEKSGEGMVQQTRKKLAAATSEAEKANLTDDIDDFESGIEEMRNARFVPPDITTEAMTIRLGAREVRVFHPGRANTAGDLVVLVPDAGTLIAGDILVYPTPYATSAYHLEWIDVLKKLDALDVRVIIPGHGPVQRDRKYLTLVRELLESLTTQVAAAVKEGATVEDTRKRVDLEKFRIQFAGNDRRRNRAFEEYFLKPALKNAWMQAQGLATGESPF
jgi:cyclase